MDKHTFELELVQLEELFSKSRSNKYSDSRKALLFKELREIFVAVTSSDYGAFDIHEQKDHRQIFDFLFNGLEFLDTSTLNIFPFELVYCLEVALNDWVSSEDLIIVTSLSQRRSDIWFEGWEEESIRNIKQLIKAKYALDISSRLIRISLPKSLSKDYLVGVVLYHELGHFIDAELNITNRIFFDKYSKVPELINTEEEHYFYHYQKEYFADLFAAQYVDNSSAIYLNHLAYDHGDSSYHPATSKRDEIVKKFLAGESAPEIDNIQNALMKAGHPILQKRNTIITPGNSDFIDLIPQRIANAQELHGIFKLGWDFWLDSENNYLNGFSRRQRYYVINNLMEKSISNYNVLQNWQEMNTSIDG